LKAQNKLDLLDEVLAETPKVREDLGYPPLVTPMSQMVGVQATANVLAGERYKNISSEIKSYVRGEYGRPPGNISEDLKAKILGENEPITGRFADGLAPGLPAAREYLGERAKSDEDVLSYIAFPTQAEAFFKKREAKEKGRFSYLVEKLAD
ncbi:MAG TPA: oxaloacetate decarboxylase subunit alpha, partial [Clostridiales bacterium]|nr:oxaloacetate decarboxylase subunit alpha [Clostridiales bacterium]